MSGGLDEELLYWDILSGKLLEEGYKLFHNEKW